MVNIDREKRSEAWGYAIFSAVVVGALMYWVFAPLLKLFGIPTWGIWLLGIFLVFVSVGKLSQERDKAEAFRKIAQGDFSSKNKEKNSVQKAIKHETPKKVEIKQKQSKKTNTSKKKEEYLYKKNPLAFWAFITSLGFWLTGTIPIFVILLPLSITLAIMALKKTPKGKDTGRGYAWAAIWIIVIPVALVLSLVAILAVLQ